LREKAFYRKGGERVVEVRTAGGNAQIFRGSRAMGPEGRAKRRKGLRRFT